MKDSTDISKHAGFEPGFESVVSTISMYPAEAEPLREAGADLIAHPLGEAGSGLAERSLRSVTS
ncbi:MAG: hypothetical protein M3N45_09300 [Actinomycetota bacterium]|nr:hypothetical protein [Actinomycetota bacterium]